MDILKNCSTTHLNTVQVKQEENLEIYEIERVPQYNYVPKQEYVEPPLDNFEPCLEPSGELVDLKPTLETLEESVDFRPDHDSIEESVEIKSELETCDEPLYQPNHNENQQPSDEPQGAYRNSMSSKSIERKQNYGFGKELVVRLEKLRVTKNGRKLVLEGSLGNKKYGDRENIDSAPNCITQIKTQEPTVFQGPSFKFQTKGNRNPGLHLRGHRDTKNNKFKAKKCNLPKFECDNCNFQTVWKDNLKRHVLIHRKPTKINKSKCSMCDYQTARKGDLKRHELIHKSSQENKLKCDECNFQTFYKGNLRAHILTHRKHDGEIIKFKCDICDYQTIRKRNLITHERIHKNSQKVGKATKLRCNYCNFQTVFKSSLICHELSHKDSK